MVWEEANLMTTRFDDDEFVTNVETQFGIEKSK